MATMLPTIQSFMKAHQLSDVTVVADAGMVSAANRPEHKFGVPAQLRGTNPYRRNGSDWVECATSPHILSLAEYEK